MKKNPKQQIAGAIRALYDNIFKLVPLRNAIFFESIPDLSDNTKAVFDEMIRRGLNERCKLFYMVSDASIIASQPKVKNVYYVQHRLKDLFYQFYLRTAKCLICCNEFFPKYRDDQTIFYLSHGSPIKSVRNYYNAPRWIDYHLAASAAMVPHCAYELNAPEDRFFSLGFPRNDILTSACRDLKPLFPDADFDKVIVWYPTYRQTKYGMSVGGSSLPVIHDEINAAALNETAKANRVLLVLKPHFVQDVSYVKDLGLSNIMFIDDRFFAQNHISSYEFVGSCDAMITDYSSIYYDYTLCDKPVALVWEDVEEYKKSPGFSPGIDPYLDGGEKVYDLPQLQDFVCRVAQGEDPLRDIRRTVRDQVNHAADGKNACRVVDFIIEKANL